MGSSRCVCHIHTWYAHGIACLTSGAYLMLRVTCHNTSWCIHAHALLLCLQVGQRSCLYRVLQRNGALGRISPRHTCTWRVWRARVR